MVKRFCAWKYILPLLKPINFPADGGTIYEIEMFFNRIKEASVNAAVLTTIAL
jgi:hypothetical protein